MKKRGKSSQRLKIFEDGYACTNNELLTVLMKDGYFDPYEAALAFMIGHMKVFKAIAVNGRAGQVRLKKHQVLTSFTDLKARTGWSRQKVISTIGSLVEKGILKVIDKGQNGSVFEFVHSRHERMKLGDAVRAASNDDQAVYEEDREVVNEEDSEPGTRNKRVHEEDRIPANQVYEEDRIPDPSISSQNHRENHLSRSHEVKTDREGKTPLSKRKDGGRTTGTKGQSRSGGSTKSVPDLKALWNQEVPDLARIQSMNETRVRQWKARWKEEPSLEYWKEVFDRMRKSPFIRGEVKDFVGNVTWFLRPETHLKIMEGFYDERKKSKAKALDPSNPDSPDYDKWVKSMRANAPKPWVEPAGDAQAASRDSHPRDAVRGS